MIDPKGGMIMKTFLFTSESVSEGHPDKMADQISDAILDAYLTEDPYARVACETLVTTGLALIAGEVTTKAKLDLPEIARGVIRDIGYTHTDMGFDYKTCAILTSIGRQSADIAMGVNSGQNKEQGAGDQGLMFGYAINETDEFMPLSISLSHKLMVHLAEVRKSGKIPFLRPDSKSQVTVQYDDNKIARIDSVVVSTQHNPDVTQETIKQAVMEEVINRIIPRNLLDKNTKYHINPTGRFVIGGPHGDAGLTGRKIIVDTYGGHGGHGGGAFSGKDPSKVDRSAAYAARHIAKNIVAAGLAQRCLVQVAYAIGIAEPVSIYINDFGTATCDIQRLHSAVSQLWDLRPAAIIKEFDLLRPIYRKTASYGHFGRSEFSWEKLSKVEQLRDTVKKLA